MGSGGSETDAAGLSALGGPAPGVFPLSFFARRADVFAERGGGGSGRERLVARRVVVIP